MAFKKVKGLVPHLGRNNPMQRYKLGEGWLESCPAEKHTQVPVNSPLNGSQQRAQVAKEANGIVACIKSSRGQQDQESDCPLVHSTVETAP